MMITCFYIIIGSANVLNNSLSIVIMNNGSGGGDDVQEHVLPANILPAEDRPIGDPSFLENSFSLTVTKLKSDIDVNVLFILESFLKLYCTKGIYYSKIVDDYYLIYFAGGVATEVGKRAFQYHLQGVFKCRYPCSKIYVAKLSKFLRKLLGNALNYRILVKPLERGQTLEAMIGKTSLVYSFIVKHS
jgi:hypothetical protein